MNGREPSPSLEQLLEPARLGFRQALQQLLHPILDRDLLRRQHHARPAVGALEHAAERRQQAEEIDLQLRLVVVAGRLGDARVGAHELRAAQRLALVQQLRRRLVFLVLEQPADQRLARILLGPRRPAPGPAAAAASAT